MRINVVVLALCVSASAARADIQPPPPPPKISDAPRAKKLNPLLCGCASSRFLAKERAVVLGDGNVAAWLHGDSRLGGYRQDDAGALEAADLPFVFDLDERSTGGASRLVRLRATGEGQGALGIVRGTKEERPRDLVTATLSPSIASPTAPPVLKAMWLEPVEARERRDCGPWLTQRLAFEQPEGATAVDAFVITEKNSGKVTLVDARHIGAFGIGRVEVCDHGAPIVAAPAQLEIVPLSAAGGAGEAWTFSHDGTGTAPVKREAWPSSADVRLLDDPYPVPGEKARRFSWLSVGGMWILLPTTGAVLAFVAFLFWRFKRRRMYEVLCASCGKGTAIDVLDGATDGFFCPHCGASGMWKGQRSDVDVTRL